MEVSFPIILTFIAGCLAGYFGLNFFANRRLSTSRQRADDIINIAKKEAEVITHESKAKADLEVEKKRLEFEDQYSSRRRQLDEDAIRIAEQRKRNDLDSKLLKQSKSKLIHDTAAAEEIASKYRTKLDELADISREDAKTRLLDEMKVECDDEILAMKDEILGKAEEDLKAEANRIMVDTLQRFSSVTPSEVSATIVRLPSEEMKGRIIGREGRNIISFEGTTGTTLMIDETPESVLISSFDPVRREIARIALEDLVKDGRIHPAAIEAAVERAETSVKDDVIDLGEAAVNKLNIMGLNSEIIRMLGKLHFYLSNNQRTLEHSVEVAYLCSIMASELGLDPDIAKRCGLLHDIGKAMSHESEKSHAHSAALMLERLGESPIVVNAVASSHDEVSKESVYAALVQVADSLSSTRPGVRTESMEGYIKRIKDLENIAFSFDGVKDAYALKAGREIRIIVSPEFLSGTQASSLARKIRNRIENELNYPGSIKITVVREQRFVETAT